MTPMMKIVMNFTAGTAAAAAAAATAGSETGDEGDVTRETYRELLLREGEAGAGTGMESEASVIELFDIPSWMAILLSLIYFAVSFCAVIGNWMVLWIVIRSKIMRNVTNLFIANLAVADIIIGAFAIPFQFQAALLQKWLLPFFMCSFCPTVQVVSLNVSIFTLVTLSIDRHRAVTKPLKPRISKTTGYLIISGIWIVSILTAVPTFLAFRISFRPDSSSDSLAYDLNVNNSSNSPVGVNDSLQRFRESVFVPVGSSTLEEQVLEPMCWPTGLNEDFWKTYNHILVALQYMLPIIIISIAYIHMAIVLSTGPGIMNESRSESDRANHSKRRVIKMLFIVIAIFAICWLPFQAYNILQEIYPSINDYKYINLIWFSCHLFAMSNSCYNPFIYAIYGEKFNQEFRKRFYCCCFWASRVSGGPATPTTLLRSVDHMTSQVTHLNDAVTPRHKGGSYPLHILNPAGRKRNSKRSGHPSPAFIPASPDCNSLLSENISLKNNPCVSIGSPASANGDRHQKHIICRKSSKKTSIKTNGNQVQYDDSRNPAPDEEGGHPLQSPVVSEKEMISLSSSGDKKSICLEPLIADDNDDGKVSYV